MNKIILIDAMNLFCRCFFKLNQLQTSDGRKTGAVYGFLNSINYFRKQYPKYKIYILWDSKSNFRKEIYPEYKAKRKDRTVLEGYTEQQQIIRRTLRFMDIYQAWAKDFEADDLAKTLVDQYKKIAEEVEDTQCLMVTSDLDWMQLINDEYNVGVLKHDGKKYVLFDEDRFEKKNGYPVWGLTVYKALKGDSSDNIKGIMRFPTKLAVEIANNISNIEELFINKAMFNNLEHIKDRWREEIQYSKDHLRMNTKLVLLHTAKNVMVLKGTKSVKRLKHVYKDLQLESFLSEIKKQTFLKKRRTNQTEANRLSV